MSVCVGGREGLTDAMIFWTTSSAVDVYLYVVPSAAIWTVTVKLSLVCIVSTMVNRSSPSITAAAMSAMKMVKLQFWSGHLVPSTSKTTSASNFLGSDVGGDVGVGGVGGGGDGDGVGGDGGGGDGDGVGGDVGGARAQHM